MTMARVSELSRWVRVLRGQLYVTVRGRYQQLLDEQP
jgi:hypothetical protein